MNSTFFDFWELTHFCCSGIFFRNSIPKNRQFRPRGSVSQARQSIHCQKNTGTLKLIIFWKFAETFLIHQRAIYIFKITPPLYRFLYTFGTGAIFPSNTVSVKQYWVQLIFHFFCERSEQVTEKVRGFPCPKQRTVKCSRREHAYFYLFFYSASPLLGWQRFSFC